MMLIILVFKNLLGFQKMPEIRTGFPKHLIISSKVYYTRIVKSPLISALLAHRVRRKLYEIVGAESTSGDF